MPEKFKALKIADLDPDEVEWFDGYPMPPSPPLRPLHAILSVFRLLRNKEDTTQVFEVTAALSGRSGHKAFQRFVRTDYGKRIADNAINLKAVLDDRDALRALPADTYGRAYLDFMEREGLSADGILEAAEASGVDYKSETDFIAMRRMFIQYEITHDLWHVITGYGRDALGELCNLVYTYRQVRNVGFLAIVLIGLIAIKLERPGVKAIRALLEANRNAKRAAWMPGIDVEELLGMPLEAAREKSGLAATPVYDSIPDDVKRSLLKPKQSAAGAPPVHATPAE